MMSYFYSDEKILIERFKANKDSLYRVLGSRRIEKGYEFNLYAPSAKTVYLVGDFNDWQMDYPMKRIGESGLWNINIDQVKVDDNYKYLIIDKKDEQVYKSDPFAYSFEDSYLHASQYYDLDYGWEDEKWMKKRQKNKLLEGPMAIYEISLSSWKRGEDGSFYSYEMYADELVKYLLHMKYNYVEFMPLTEYPYDGSWGYQVSGYFASSKRFGDPEQLMYLIDQLHKNNIGVIMDWSGSHFCVDEFSLSKFDGSYLFESDDPYMATSPWGSLYFDYKKEFVQDFLSSSISFWMDKFHVDGFRIDAVSSMIYLDYSGRKIDHRSQIYDQAAIKLIKRINKLMDQNEVFSVAEDSGKTKNLTDESAYNFDFRWNLGWMHESLDFFQKDYKDRKKGQGDLVNSFTYFFKDHFILAISHDELVHMKKSLLDKMPGDYLEKFDNYRLFLAYMYAFPGKKLLFMGSELATFDEWDHDGQLAWNILDYDSHQLAKKYNRKLNDLYRGHKALYELDRSWQGIELLDYKNYQDNILVFERISKDDERIICVFNFSRQLLPARRIGVKEKGIYTILLNSSHRRYGGKVKRNNYFYSKDIGAHGRDHSILVDIEPLQALYIRLNTKL